MRKFCRKIFYYPGLLWRPYAIGASILVVISIVLTGIPIIVISYVYPKRPLLTKIIHFWNDLILAIYGADVVVEGVENHKSHEAALVVSNHQSLFDIPVAYRALTGDMRMLAKAELFKIPIFGHSMKATDFIRVDRASRRSGLAAVEAIKIGIARGLHIWVAPEGTRSTEGPPGIFKKGSFAAAIAGRLPIQPIAVETRHGLPKGSLLGRPGQTFYVKVLPRIYPKGDEEAIVLSERVRGEIAEALKNQSLAKGT